MGASNFVCVCVCCFQNEEAEELMRHVEQEEEEAAAHDPEALQLHLCIINLVIGTLYCSKVRRRSAFAAHIWDDCWDQGF